MDALFAVYAVHQAQALCWAVWIWKTGTDIFGDGKGNDDGWRCSEYTHSIHSKHTSSLLVDLGLCQSSSIPGRVSEARIPILHELPNHWTAQSVKGVHSSCVIFSGFMSLQLWRWKIYDDARRPFARNSFRISLVHLYVTSVVSAWLVPYCRYVTNGRVCASPTTDISNNRRLASPRQFPTLDHMWWPKDPSNFVLNRVKPRWTTWWVKTY